jgi:lysophospholipase II
VEETSLDGRDDIEGLDASAAHVANLLSSEPYGGTYFKITL